MSSHKRKINLRVVAGGLLLQFTLALLIRKTVPGRLFFSSIGDFFTAVLNSVDAGSSMVFGKNLADHLLCVQGAANDPLLFIADGRALSPRHCPEVCIGLCHRHAVDVSYFWGGKRVGCRQHLRWPD